MREEGGKRQAACRRHDVTWPALCLSGKVTAIASMIAVAGRQAATSRDVHITVVFY